ncbi:hypothetical protein KKE47_02880 [Patescibacteria group bacterium]|nr:hypothetical protein [Patescibacteria group bacterium]MBU4389822.1 hypothetical protein [Patescibacteria group bacterium]MBU4578513.1 hypothetical protein [Patescibacteria group bacterium]MCG2702325.1 hypothetical protein [Candidatus Parcubacteria bacterium]
MTKLNLDEVKKQLAENHLSVDDLMEKFWRMDSYGTVLTNPIFLEALIVFVTVKKGDINFSKFEFYKYFFDKIIGGNFGLRQKLQKLALGVETKQSNKLEQKEFSKLLSKTGVEKKEIEKLGLLSVLDDDKIGFFHHTLSEFLVAESWIENDRVLNELKKLLIVGRGEVLALSFSWFGVIRFLLDSEKGKEVLGWMMNLARANPQIIDEGFCDTITSIDPAKLKPKKKAELFALIYRTYRQKRVWLPLWTRASLPSFCQNENYEAMKALVDVKKGTDTDKLVRLATIVDIIARLMEDKSPLITRKERDWWKERLVDYANDDNENGVLQRRALKALATYKDIGLIERVGGCFGHKDSLVRQAFLEFCSDTAPNSEKSIKWMVEGIKRGDAIYARYGLYKISSLGGIKILLKKLVDDSKFLKKFLDRESIFNNKDRNGDQSLIEVIEKFKHDDRILSLVKAVIKKAFNTREIYYQERSYFLKELARIMESVENDYIFQIIEEAMVSGEERPMFVYDYIPLFSWLLNQDNVLKFHKRFKKFDDKSGRFGQQSIYRSRFEGKDGERAYKKAVKLGIVEKIEENDWQKERKNNEYGEFKRLLGNDKKKKYYPAVFKYFWQSEKAVRELWQKDDEKRLRRLVLEEGLDKIEPRKFKLKIARDYDGKRSNQYTISSIFSYFGDLIKVARLLKIKIDPSVRQKIIDFIPFAYSGDRQIILDVVKKVSDEELEWVNSQYLNKKSDVRYFLPGAYVYFARIVKEKDWRVKSVKGVLVSFVTDEDIAEHDRKYALETLGKYITSGDGKIKQLLEGDFGDEKIQKVADDILISVFKDRVAIERRIEKIKAFAQIAKGYEEPESGMVHAVGEIEGELSEMNLAKSLFRLGSNEYKDYFFELLDYSAELLNKDSKAYWQYVNYLWRIVVGYFAGLENKNLDLIKGLEEWLYKNRSVDRINWFEDKLRILKRSFADTVFEKGRRDG